MAKINKVAHVVLNVRDMETSIKFYTEALGMEVVARNEEMQMVFLTFGTQHHDLALFKAAEGAESGGLGLNHVAFQIDGGEEELKQVYHRLQSMGVRIQGAFDVGLIRTVVFFNPDGNQLETFCEMMEQKEATDFLRVDAGRMYEPLELEPISAS